MPERVNCESALRRRTAVRVHASRGKKGRVAPPAMRRRAAGSSSIVPSNLNRLKVYRSNRLVERE